MHKSGIGAVFLVVSPSKTLSRGVVIEFQFEIERGYNDAAFLRRTDDP
jgi:hypothetical protein